MKEKLFNIQQELKSSKDNYNEFGKFNYRNLESILADLKPILKKYNCIITFNDEIVNVGASNYIKSKVTLTDIDSGESFSVDGWAREDENKAGMSNGQMTGCASSYSRKYGICGLFAINEEKDLDALDNRPTQSKQQPTQYKPKSYTQTQQNDLEWKDETKDNLTVLTDYCSQVTANGFDRSEVGKFFRFYKDKCNSWNGKFDCERLFSNWMSKAKAAA